MSSDDENMMTDDVPNLEQFDENQVCIQRTHPTPLLLSPCCGKVLRRDATRPHPKPGDSPASGSAKAGKANPQRGLRPGPAADVVFRSSQICDHRQAASS